MPGEARRRAPNGRRKVATARARGAGSTPEADAGDNPREQRRPLAGRRRGHRLQRLLEPLAPRPRDAGRRDQRQERRAGAAHRPRARQFGSWLKQNPTLKTWPFRTEDQFCSQTEFTPRKRGHKLQRLNANSFEPNRSRICGLALPCAALADRPARRLPSRGRSTAHRDQPQARRPGRSAPLRDAPDPLSRRSFSKLRRAATCPPRTLPSAGRW